MRRPAQALIEFVPIGIAFFTLCAAAIVISYYLLVGWGGGRALAAQGFTYSTTGNWDVSALVAQSQLLGVVISEADTAITIIITPADGTVGLCPAPSGCDGWTTTPSLAYGDHVAIRLSKTVGQDVQEWWAMPAVTASWSGIAQRNTISNPSLGESVGTISGTVVDNDTGSGIVGATVAYSSTAGSGSTSTSAGGAYTLQNVPSNGSITITVSAIGYVTATNTIALATNQSLSQSVGLDEGAYVRVFVTSDASTPNLVANDGFESGTSGWSLAGGALGVDSAASGPGTTGTNPLDESQAGSFTAAAGSSPTGIKYALSGLSEGTQYSATVWMRGASGATYLRLGTDLNYQTSADLELSSTWDSVTVSWIADATSATLVVLSENGNAVVLDAVRVWESDGAQTGATVITDLLDAAIEDGEGFYYFTLVPPSNPTSYIFEANIGSLRGCVTDSVSLSSTALYLEITVGLDSPGC
jgi:hypothetical protein